MHEPIVAPVLFLLLRLLFSLDPLSHTPAHRNRAKSLVGVCELSLHGTLCGNMRAGHEREFARWPRARACLADRHCRFAIPRPRPRLAPSLCQPRPGWPAPQERFWRPGKRRERHRRRTGRSIETARTKQPQLRGAGAYVGLTRTGASSLTLGSAKCTCSPSTLWSSVYTCGPRKPALT